MTQPFTSPKLNLTAYHCPWCRAYSNQTWGPAYQQAPKGGWLKIGTLTVSHCSHCGNFGLWWGEHLVFPAASPAPPANVDLPDDIKRDYEEARSIVSASPRGAAALLRLAIQKLCKHLGEPGDNINADIGALVKKGLPVKVQEALDAVRVIGNESVHPGQIDLKDDVTTATALFGLVNFITEKMVTEPKTVASLYAMVPADKLKGIKARDGKP